VGLSRTITTAQSRHQVVTVEFDAEGTTNYQAELTVNTRTGGYILLQSITWSFVGWVAHDEQVVTDPARAQVLRMDSSSNVSGYLGNEGALMAMLQPGDNHLMIRCEEVTAPLIPEYPPNKLDRTPTVTVTYTPRYSL
jgi:hypothetical protein